MTLHYYEVCPPLDTFLDLLEGNCSLEYVDLTIEFDEFPAQIPQHRDVTMNQLQYLSITCWDAMIARTMVSSIPLRRGVDLEITLREENTGLGLNDILSDIPTTHLSNLSSSTSLVYWSPDREVWLNGPNGSLSYSHKRSRDRDLFQGVPFIGFPALPLTNVQEFCLAHSESPIMFHPPSFPTLETFTIEGGADLSHLLSALFSNPSASPLLKTLKFWDCTPTEKFMEELTQFASDRKDTTSAQLDRVMIIHRDGKLPSTDSIRRLGRHVPVVDVGTKLIY